MADSKSGAEKIQDKLEHLLVLESKETLKCDEEISKRTQNLAGRGSPGQISDNLSIKINEVSNRL